MKKVVSSMCGAALSEYIESGTDWDERHLKSISVRENMHIKSWITVLFCR